MNNNIDLTMGGLFLADVDPLRFLANEFQHHKRITKEMQLNKRKELQIFKFFKNVKPSKKSNILKMHDGCTKTDVYTYQEILGIVHPNMAAEYEMETSCYRCGVSMNHPDNLSMWELCHYCDEDLSHLDRYQVLT